ELPPAGDPTRATACGRVVQLSAASAVVIPAGKPGSARRAKSRNPVTRSLLSLRRSVVTGSRLCARPPEAGSLGRDDGYMRLPCGGRGARPGPTDMAAGASKKSLAALDM